ncbi:hypothetical protein HELRODRAFT_72205 [Helobdella robusta]|uniref:hypoxia-inducible factor-proline dioxygenase n=1 Tax=Helobdella robusta TaxID=6412 RepID=T1G0X1_HELRO|nr:hypothetical protein HELRODRAFT_72205 [Helobdella robusta]ESO10904.1 hypothetical protein HELRODRAFT_72205 [Helobdella robusta]
MPNLNFINANILDTTQEDVFNLTFTDAPAATNQFNLKQNVSNLHQHQQQDLTTAQLLRASLQQQLSLLTTSTNDENSLENNHTVSSIQKSQQLQQNQHQQQNQQSQQTQHLQQQLSQQQRLQQQHQLVKQPTFQQQRDIQEQKISDYAFNCLTEYDFCVLDHFQGSQKSLNLLNEVQKIINSQRFEDGRLMASNQDSLSVRGDKIFWLGDLNMTPCIMQLIQKMARIIFKFNERLSNVCIRSHSKPMLACYPGSGAGYMRHVDNSNQDGRLITCLYYLNKDWNAKVDGGMLRLHPSIKHEKVDVEPLLDRLLLFWSDCRNPHEVLPSFKNRYAITVWYFDTEEREQAKLKLQGC